MPKPMPSRSDSFPNTTFSGYLNIKYVLSTIFLGRRPFGGLYAPPFPMKRSAP